MNTTTTIDAQDVSYTAPYTGAVTATQSELNQWTSLNVLNFMTETQRADILNNVGSIDCTAAFQAAINALPVQGGIIELPSGTIFMTTVQINRGYLYIRGNPKGTRIIDSSTTADLFQIGDGSTKVSGVRFENLSIWASSTKTAGTVFNCNQLESFQFVNVCVGSNDDYVANGNVNRLWNGYIFNRFAQGLVFGGEIVCANYPVQANGNVDQSFGAELVFDGGLDIQYSTKNNAVLLGGGTGGVYFGRVNISSCAGGIWWSKTLTDVNNREAFVSDLCTIDSCPSRAISVASDSLETLDLKGWISACGNDKSNPLLSSIWVDITTATPPVACEINASGLRVQDSLFDGVQVSSGTLNWVGGLLRSNGTGINGGHGLVFGAGRLNLSGVQVYNNGNSTRGYGLLINGAISYTVIGNNFFSNGQGSINNDNVGFSTTGLIRSNVGYVTENIGSTQILSGQTTVAVNHGLAAAPSLVLITMAGQQDGGAYAYVAPSSYTATQFTITYSVPAGANRPFVWQAFMGTE
ncbi:hypothetical protein ACFONN_10705 [Dyella humi]|uniref:Uncharacterized protein n=1 Tax=Dyella humi TaxID=1770547 RepID=A0ABW8IL72_9GAMM